MKRAVLLIIPALLILAGCQTGPREGEKTMVYVTIQPQTWFVRNLMTEKMDVSVMIPPGLGHSNYDPTPKQVRDLSHAAVYLSIGYLGFEQAWLPRITKNNPKLPVVNLSAGIPAIVVEGGEHQHEEHEGHDDCHEGIDPHTWMSPRSARMLATNTAHALAAAQPDCKQLIMQNLEALLLRIDRLDSAYTSRLAGITERKFIIFHPALTYLARDYDLVQYPMELGGKEPSAAHLKSLVDVAKQEGIKTIFVQKEFDQENARTLAKELNAKIIQIDPLSSDWEKEMYHILDKLTGNPTL